MLRKICLVAFLIAGLLPAWAAAQLKDGRVYKSETFKIQFPHTWWIDPFGSSAVCDCEGLIAGIDEDQPKIVIYPTDQTGMADPIRDQVWDYQWPAASGTPRTYVTKRGIRFDGFAGSWVDAADEHVVLRWEAHQGDHYVRIFMFGPGPSMEANRATLENVLETFSWR